MTPQEGTRWTPVGYRKPKQATVYRAAWLFRAKSRYVTRKSVSGQKILHGKPKKLKQGLFVAREQPTPNNEELAEYHGVVINQKQYDKLSEVKRGHCLA